MENDFRTCNCKNQISLSNIKSLGRTTNTFDQTKPKHIHWFNCPGCRTTFIVFSLNEEGPTPDEFAQREQ